MQEILDLVGRAASWLGMEFNARKCATLHVKTRKARKDTDTYIQEQPIPTFDHGDTYQHLGVPTGLYVEQTPEDTFKKMIQDLKAVEASLLTPWQKLDAIRTFILPQAQFTLLTSNIKKSALEKIDKEIKRASKNIFNLPRRASPEVVFIPASQGGANLPPLSDLADIGSVVRAFKMITCPDRTVREIAEASLRQTAAAVLEQKELTFQHLCSYLSGDQTPKYSRAATIWSAARSAARRLSSKLTGLRWSWSEAKFWSLTIPMPGRAPDCTILRIEKTVPGSNSREKPDLVVLDEKRKRASIIDIACPFENRYEALEAKREEKIRKYSPLADVLKTNGYQVDVDAVVVGALGTWDAYNDRALALLGIPATKRNTMKKLIVSDVIRWSRDIYVEHVSRARQYKEDVVISLGTVASH
ncbi:hypothetical protein KUF71_007117 [Frankliniella fusca]|uniref:Reverse transcriptase n=1 Tax=Frankliniella fusca TaxID=407009 RepID=A0AAE1HAC3_9NEOP|nr:hypothetical protein KUF71_007117 [Frankliniella fusca]